MLDLATRDTAMQSLPTPERVAKGDIEIFWPEESDTRSTIPTARAVYPKTVIQRLRDNRLLTPEHYAACMRLRTLHGSHLNQVIAKVRIATWQNSGLPRSEWQSSVEAMLHLQWCYNFLRNPDNGIPTADLNKLERVVCDDESPRFVMKGRNGSQVDRFVRLVDRLTLVLKTMPHE